jgi:hypothetical protein
LTPDAKRNERLKLFAMALNHVAVGYAVAGLFTPVVAGHIHGATDGLPPLVWQEPVRARTDAPGTLSALCQILRRLQNRWSLSPSSSKPDWPQRRRLGLRDGGDAALAAAAR